MKDATIKQGDRVRRKDRRDLGTVTFVHRIGSSETVIVEWKSCGNYYSANADVLELVPADWKPRWR